MRTSSMKIMFRNTLIDLMARPSELARRLGVSRKALSEFVNEKSSLSPEMAIRISIATKTSPESWLNMQQKLTLWIAEQNAPTDVIEFDMIEAS